MASIGNPGHV